MFNELNNMCFDKQIWPDHLYVVSMPFLLFVAIISRWKGGLSSKTCSKGEIKTDLDIQLS